MSTEIDRKVLVAQKLLRIAYLLVHKARLRKLANLNPPIGSPGGPKTVLSRVTHNVSMQMRLAIEAALEADRDLTQEQYTRLYTIQRIKGPDPFLKVDLTQHAQYRMDLRSVTVKDVQQALESFVKQIKTWIASKDPQDRVKLRSLYADQYDWTDAATKVRIGLTISQKETGVLVVKTAFRIRDGQQAAKPTSRK